MANDDLIEVKLTIGSKAVCNIFDHIAKYSSDKQQIKEKSNLCNKTYNLLDDKVAKYIKKYLYEKPSSESYKDTLKESVYNIYKVSKNQNVQESKDSKESKNCQLFDDNDELVKFAQTIFTDFFTAFNKESNTSKDSVEIKDEVKDTQKKDEVKDTQKKDNEISEKEVYDKTLKLLKNFNINIDKYTDDKLKGFLSFYFNQGNNKNKLQKVNDYISKNFADTFDIVDSNKEDKSEIKEDKSEIKEDKSEIKEDKSEIKEIKEDKSESIEDKTINVMSYDIGGLFSTLFNKDSPQFSILKELTSSIGKKYSIKPTYDPANQSSEKEHTNNINLQNKDSVKNVQDTLDTDNLKSKDLKDLENLKDLKDLEKTDELQELQEIDDIKNILHVLKNNNQQE